jgi:fermentation-respiration switch protein FrsA (DUF1100 family)
MNLHQFIFARNHAPQPLPHSYDQTTEVISLPTSEGSSVAFFVPAAPHAPAATRHPTAIFFHGNTEIIDYQSTVIEGYRKLGCSILLPEYRGYGRSDGTPGEKAIVEDAISFYDLLVQRANVDPDRIVVHGRSLGGGPAAQLAARRKVSVLILQSTFRDVSSWVSRFSLPLQPAQGMFQTDRVLRSLDCPVLIMHGTRDDLVPVEHAWALRDASPNATYVEYDCMHNDFPGIGNSEDYWQRIGAFLRNTGVLNS